MKPTQPQQQNDVLILGAGVIGLSCALQLLKAGRQVCLLDRGRPAESTAAGSCGTITPSHAPPLNTPGIVSQAIRWSLAADAPLRISPTIDIERLQWFWHFARRSRQSVQQATTNARAAILLRSRELLEKLIQEEKLACEFETQGTLYTWRSEQAFNQARSLADQLNRLGLQTQILSQQEVLKKEPNLNESIIGGLHHLRDAQLHPQQYLKELVRRVKELGGQIISETSVQRIHTEQGQIDHIETDDGQQYRAREYIMALGSWTPSLARQIKLNIPIQPGKGYSITFPNARYPLQTPLVLKERSVCVTAWKDGYRLGSTMEFSGFDESLNPQRLNALKRAAHEYLNIDTENCEQQEWFGWRPMTWDELPVIGRSEHYSNLCIATGHGMLGVTMSAATGEAIREIICQQASSLNLAPYRPERFADKHYH